MLISKTSLGSSAVVLPLVGQKTLDVDGHVLTVPMGALIAIVADVAINFAFRSTANGSPGNVTALSGTAPGFPVAANTPNTFYLGPTRVAIEVVGSTGNLALFYIRSGVS